MIKLKGGNIMNNEKILGLRIKVYEDDFGDVRGEEIEKNEENISFSVFNLDECPEDAIIGRNLFTSVVYIRALNQGIELAKKGYTGVAYYAEQNEKGD